MSAYTFALLLFGTLAGVVALSLTGRERSPILYDRLVVAGLGALAGLGGALALLGGWHVLAWAFALAGV